MAAHRPHRSMLYMPASNERALEKAKTLKADGYIFDLEDAVRADAKEGARRNAVGAASSGDYAGSKVLIRANALDTEWGLTDLKAIATSGADGVVIPKIYTGEDVRAAEQVLLEAGAPPEVEVWIMMETPASFLHAGAIASSSKRLTGMIIGSNDLIKDLRAKHTPDRRNILPALMMAVLAARAHGLLVLDAVFNRIRDVEAFRTEAVQALEMGFDGKSLVHPSQIDPVNEIFSPGAEDVTHAKQVIAAYEEALKVGKGVATLDGQMVEELHVEEAKRLIEIAESISGA